MKFKLILVLAVMLGTSSTYSQTTVEALNIKTILPIKQDIFAAVEGSVKAKTNCNVQKAISFELSIDVLKYYTSIPDNVFEEPSEEDINEAVMQAYSTKAVRNLKNKCKK